MAPATSSKPRRRPRRRRSQAAATADKPVRKLAAEFCHERRDRLTGKEAEFVANLMTWRVTWREPTVRQLQWLNDIYARLRQFTDEAA